MSQPSVASFFNTRKRHAPEDINLLRSKQALNLGQDDPTFKSGIRTRSGRTIKRIGTTETETCPKSPKIEEAPLKPKKLVEFIKKGNLSPVKRVTSKKPEIIETTAFSSKESAHNVVRGNKSKHVNLNKEEIKGLVRKELKFDEVKTKISRSEKLKELKSSLSRIQELDKTLKAQEENNNRLRNGLVPVKNKNAVSLKEFKTIDLEVLTSPKKGFKTPTKVVPKTPDKNELMSEKRTEKPKRILFSPSKDGSPSKMVVPPAYQKFLNLVETSKTKLTLPYKYRYLIEMFRALDSVCVMFHNRKEIISFKKVKPAVQRIIRKNFHESHLAQIKHIFPEAFNFQQVKMRNFGSTSKADYYQLIITPNVEGLLKTKDNETDANKSDDTNIFPQEMVDRLEKFESILMARVFEAHDNFLKSLDPPLIISKDKVVRWHPEFDLESCPDIEQGYIPQPPNIEKFASAKDILSTARNLFNCATPMERALKRLEDKKEADKLASNEKQITNGNQIAPPKETSIITPEPVESILKGVPKSLLEKIRAKQAAKAFDAITRRPSQDEEATKYSRLPQLARHLRNVFISEKKSVLPLGIVIKKIDNSYRTSLRYSEIEQLLQLIAKECPVWISFHQIRETMYLKLAKDHNLAQVIEKLENVANEKAK